MTTPNRPPLPDWYQAERRVPAHAGPTQRELLARRVKSLRTLLVGVSFVGAAAFTALAAQHGGTAATTTSSQPAIGLIQRTTPSTSSTASNASSSAATSATLSAPSSTQATSSQTSSSFRTTTASS